MMSLQELDYLNANRPTPTGPTERALLKLARVLHRIRLAVAR